jgi:speckle-type POZ protein
MGLGVGKSIDSGTFIVGGRSWHLRYYPDGYDDNCSDKISFFVLLDPCTYGGDADVRALFRLSLLDSEGTPVPEHSKKWSPVRTFNLKGTGAVSGCGYREFMKRAALSESNCLQR